MKKISSVGLDLIKRNEGCVLYVYKDPIGIPTSGYGHTSGLTISDVGKKITQAQADADLKTDLAKFEKNVNKYDNKYDWTQEEFDALVSFAFNIGSIDKLTDYGKRSKSEIAEKILVYNKAGGKVLPGLTKRRQEEHDLFISNNKKENIKMGSIQQFSLAKDGEVRLSPHFKVKEFRCKDGSDMILIDTDFVLNQLERIRNHFNKPVIINSAFRTASYNNKVGGAKSSYHMQGMAFDIAINGVTPNEVAKYALSINIPGIIRYNTFTHVDNRSKQYRAINDNGKVTTVTSF